MATAFAALVNIMQIIDEIEHHPRPPISLDKQQVQSLIQNVTFLQEFLEVYNNHLGYNKEADPVEMRIAGAAHAVEDVIESHIAERILAEGEETGSVDWDEMTTKSRLGRNDHENSFIASSSVPRSSSGFLHRSQVENSRRAILQSKVLDNLWVPSTRGLDYRE